MAKYFGTDGYRGEANVTLTCDSAFRIGKFLGWYYGKEKAKGERCRIVIGKDTRRSSYMFEYAIAAGITAAGADAYLLHVTTTPSVSYVVRTEDFDCGVMISASHNPYYDNGIKIINGNGEKLGDDVIEEIEKYLDNISPEVPLARGENIGKTVDFSAGRNRYIGYLIALATKSFKGKKIALDLANGSASSIAKAVFDALGADTFVLNNSPDGFNINRNAGSTHIEGLQKFVREKGLDAGFAYDGDADRCLAVDEDGNLVDGDQEMFLAAQYLKENGQLFDNTVVTTVMSNMGLYKAFDECGINYVTTQVGDRYVYENMSQNGYSLGGEQSGHIIFLKNATTGDGILTSIKLMELMLAKKKSLKELLKDYRVFPQVLKNVEVSDKDSVMKDEDLIREEKFCQDELKNDGRILIRASGTEMLVRIMVEARTKEVCEEYCERMIDVLKRKGLVLGIR